MYHVLIAEDEELILQGIKNIVDWDSLGLEVVHMAENGETAYDLWKKKPVDIVISDINMPKKSGLEFLEAVRRTDDRVRFIILTGYDQFDYAKKAIQLDVEDYILKPIDEEQLEHVLRESTKKLKKLDRQSKKYMDESLQMQALLNGKLTYENWRKDMESQRMQLTGPHYFLVYVKWKESADDGMLEEMMVSCDLMLKEVPLTQNRFMMGDYMLLLLESRIQRTEAEILEYYTKIQNHMESEHNYQTFIAVSNRFDHLKDIYKAHQETEKLKKYKIIYGYGSCIGLHVIENRTRADLSLDKEHLQKLILKKDKDRAMEYLEDLFVNTLNSEQVTIDSLFLLTVKTAMVLHGMKEEYKLDQMEEQLELVDMLDTFYQAEDIISLKSMFVSEVTSIIDYLHTADSCYTPVVRQILSEIHENYTAEMNLKTLASKYNMNTSYLGQIFQKETGFTFAKYVNHVKNSAAKDMILNTNKRIQDIAREVGYTDTSYFYRKFKQSYGVSPAALRVIKKY